MPFMFMGLATTFAISLVGISALLSLGLFGDMFNYLVLSFGVPSAAVGLYQAMSKTSVLFPNLPFGSHARL